ncbi:MULTISPECIES: autotransporter domain-containing protein [unclassified Leclercia]|uniref:Autotransporter domain-containing protein n=1 Tax=Leclercia barmai TaxID=2785629 RepID=A0ABS7RVP4_9ENTR|nr:MULTISPECIES: autotransporter domain-containing protein [unclassified Leclercia]MBZ0058337.1 autotransporter domain-containing protein [Leclercia sp. EMC7]MCM5696543.1 autotransporter domain-containing protein [Leclercia sp. LTM01]MCM5700895.1 autotransporter domain-containing protein [Leclercia sp. LTM14]
MEKKRLSQLISLLVASSAAQAFATSPELIIDTPTSNVQITDSKELVHITQAGSITGTPTTALTLNADVTVTTLTNDGIINGSVDNPFSGNDNIVQINGTVGTLNNNGTISSLRQYQNGSVVAVGATGVVDTFTNSGTLESMPGSYSIFGFNNTGTLSNAGTIGTLTNTADGKIVGYRGINNLGTIDNLTNAGLISSVNNENGMYVGQKSAIFNSGTIGTLHNTGTIEGGTTDYYGTSAIINQGVINTLVNDDKINGSSYGIINSGTLGTLENNGTITANDTAVYNNSSNSKIGTIENNGEISGNWSGIYIWNYNNQGNTEIVNNGQLSGGGYALFVNGNNSDTVTLNNTGTVTGDIYSTSATPLTINGGANMGTLTGLDGATGTITASNVTFGSGALLLNDNISTFSSIPEYGLMSVQMSDEVEVTPGIVLNEAASLQVNNSLNILGDYHQKAAATLISGVSDLAVAGGDLLADAGYGRLNVSGNATIDAGSSINLLRTGNTYQFAEGQRYVVINAAGAQTDYHADQLNYKALGYRGTVNGTVYEDAQSKALVLTLGAEPVTPDPVEPQPEPQPEPTPEVTPPVVTEPEVTPPVVTTPVQPTQPAPSQPAPAQPGKQGYATIPSATASLGGLASYSGIASPELLNLYNASLAIEGKKEANRVGERLSTSQNLNTSSAATVATSTAQAVVGAHIDAVRNPQASGVSGVATGDDYANNWIVWGQPFGGYARQDSSDDVSGYSAKFGGLIIGADRALGDDWRLGAALNYSNTSVHGKDNLSGNNSTADNYGVIGYAGYTGNPWYLNLSAGLNRQNYSSVRRADFTGFSGAAHGKFNGQSVTLQGEFGYPIALPADVVLTPLAGLTYGYQHVDGYSETGGNGMALDVSSTHSQSVVSDIGARIEKTFATGLGNLTPFAQVSWIHQYDNRQVSSHATYAADAIGETSFITKGASPVEDMAGIAIGSTLYDANDLSFDARYDLQAGDRYQAHTFSLRLRKSF